MAEDPRPLVSNHIHQRSLLSARPGPTTLAFSLLFLIQPAGLRACTRATKTIMASEMAPKDANRSLLGMQRSCLSSLSLGLFLLADNDFPQDRYSIPTSATVVEEGGYGVKDPGQHSKVSSNCTLLPLMTTIGAPTSNFMMKNADPLIGGREGLIKLLAQLRLINFSSSSSVLGLGATSSDPNSQIAFCLILPLSSSLRHFFQHRPYQPSRTI